MLKVCVSQKGIVTDVRFIRPSTTHDAELAIRTLAAGKDCVVDKVMALSDADATWMIAARDAAGRLLSVFHNRRWDWDFLTLKDVLARGRIGRPLLFESAVCRHAAPRTWRGWGASPSAATPTASASSSGAAPAGS